MSPTAWKAQPDEAETVARLLIAFRDWWGRDWPSDNAFLAGVERLMSDTATEFLLCAKDADSPPVAVAQIRFRWGIWHASNDCWLEDLYVEPEARGSGLAKALIDAAVASAKARGSRRLELDVSESNEAALGLYESLGFRCKSAPGRDLMMHLPLSGD
jgi:ribosomal protein S18 acetylase RimI-like enzyme